MPESDFSQNAYSEIEFFNHKIIANLQQNATEIVKFPKTYEIGFFGEKSLFFRKKNTFFSKLVQMANLL